jgi:hypothetical protein
MFRKLIITLGATVALAASVGSASAWSHHHHHHGHGWGAFGAGLALGLVAPAVTAPVVVGCYKVKRWVATPYGPRLRRVTVCN